LARWDLLLQRGVTMAHKWDHGRRGDRTIEAGEEDREPIRDRSTDRTV